MANKKRPTPKKSDIETKNNYYDIKVEAVNELVDALNSDPNVPLTEEQKRDPNTPNPYKRDLLSRIPTWVKMIFVKYWMGGAFCFFIYMGLPILVGNIENVVLLSGLILGVVIDWMYNSALLYFETDREEFHPYMLLPVSCKKMWTIFINVPYGMLVVFVIYFIYRFLNTNIFETELSVEPLLYGLIYLIVDMFFISIKNLIVWVVRKVKNNYSSGE